MQLEASDTADESETAPVHDPYAAIRRGNFRRYLAGNLVSVLAMQMQSTTIGWEVYRRTGEPLVIGLVGLVQVIPVLALTLMAGHVADRSDRKLVLMGAIFLSGLASLGLAVVSFFQADIGLMFGCLLLIGIARAFQQPAKSSFLPQLVPRSVFPNAVTWSLSGFQLASVAGPALGGLLLAQFGFAWIIYLFQVAAAVAYVCLLAGVERTTSNLPPQSATLKSLAEGIGFVWHKKVVLAAMALDMFAVLLGGATALLPVYAQTVLKVGPTGYGWLAAAPAMGALLMSLALMYRRPMARAGATLLWAVAGFGAATIVFGLSTSYWVSLVALAMTGAFDCISVVVRHSLVQMLTPDSMRGRVSAISGMFISASNELGEFESGVAAQFTSPLISVVGGGIGTLLVVATAALAMPQLRGYGRLDGSDHGPRPPGEPAELAESQPARL